MSATTPIQEAAPYRPWPDLETHQREALFKYLRSVDIPLNLQLVAKAAADELENPNWE